MMKGVVSKEKDRKGNVHMVIKTGCSFVGLPAPEQLEKASVIDHHSSSAGP